MRCLLLSLLLCFLLGAQASNRRSLFFVDSQTNSYFETNDVAVSIESIDSLMASILGLKAKSSEPSALVTSSLKKPSAHCVFNLAGFESDDLKDIFSGQMHEVQAPREASTIASISDALADIAQANPSLSLIMLDEQGLATCKSNCLEEQRGTLIAAEAPLDLDSVNGKLFSIELSSFLSGLNAQVTRQDIAEMALEGDVQIIEATLAALDGLSDETPEVVAAAKKAVKSLLKASIEKLNEAYGGDVTYQVNGFNATEETNVGGRATIQEIMGWKMEARRKLAANAGVSVTSTAKSSTTVFPPEDQKAASKSFSTKAAGYGAFILILYFSLAAIWCMCFMPIKHDTLLFGAKKE